MGVAPAQRAFAWSSSRQSFARDGSSVGDTDDVRRGARVSIAALPTYYQDRIRVSGSRRCWLWLGYIEARGYGCSTTNRGGWGVHRQVWWLLKGTRAKVLHHDPRCPKHCCNPEHLTMTTHETHPDSAPQWQRAKTHCPHGHPYSGDNLGIIHRSNGLRQRRCNTCHRRRNSQPKGGLS